MAKYVGYKRPKDTKKTVKHLLTYLGHYKWAFLLIAILVFVSAGAGIMGTFLIKPVVNNFIVPGNMKGPAPPAEILTISWQQHARVHLSQQPKVS